MERKMYEGKSPKAIKDAVRADAIPFLINLLASAVGIDNVTRTASNMIVFSFADTTLDTGEIVEIPIAISPTIKEYVDTITSTGKEREAYDRIKEGEIYEDECRENAEKKRIAAERKAKQIQRDKKRRESKE